jgi:cytochrome P450
VQAVIGHPNFWIVAGHDTVTEVLLDPNTYDGQPFPDRELPIMSAMRPEPHKRIRHAAQAMFTRPGLEQLSGFIEEQARLRTTHLLADGGGDLMTLWATPLALSVVATTIGFPPLSDADIVRLHHCGDSAVRAAIPYGGVGLPPLTGPRARLRQLRGLAAALPAAARLARRLPRHERATLRRAPNPFATRPGYPRLGLARDTGLARPVLDLLLEILTIFESHMAQPGSAMIDGLIAPYQRGELSLAEILSATAQTLVAGYQTTRNGLASAVHRLAENPGLIDRLRDDPSYVDGFIEETLRLDTPQQRTLRRTTRPVTLAGTRLPENAQLIVMIGAANVDPERYSCPEQFEPQRSDMNRHLAFGTGIHFCIGAQLARQLSRIALATFAHQIAEVQLDPNDLPERIDDHDIGIWGFSRFPVRVVPRADSRQTLPDIYTHSGRT